MNRHKSPEQYPFIPKKHFGQHFLIDANVIRRIIGACGLKKEDTVLEIGPGSGALTRAMASQVDRLYAVESDPQLCRKLREEFSQPHVQILGGDFLKFELNRLPPITKVIGNLPYYISTLIIERILSHRERFRQAFFTVQLEFGQRLAAGPPGRDYGALSCFVQYFADPKVLFKIPNSCFRPVPKVTSCFVSMPIKETPAPRARDEELLFRVIRMAFQQRRKKIRNSLAKLIPPDQTEGIFQELDLNKDGRAETFALGDYVRLADRLSSGGQKKN